MKRARALHRLSTLVSEAPVVLVLGPRQSGKTTLVMELSAQQKRRLGEVTRFDLEDPRERARLDEPLLALEELRGLIVLDEVQLRPELFPVLRVLVDRGPKTRRFVVLGSASGDLLRQSSESLAGRVAFFELMPFSPYEARDHPRLWLRGGFPPAYLASSHAAAFRWLNGYVRTFLERDVPNLGIHVPSQALRRFWMMLAHYHGQVANYSEMGRSLGLTDKTVRNYVDILSQTFMLRQLAPWHENIAKRQVRSPKIYFRDSGLLHALLGVTSRKELDVHPKLGASWEGFALECVARELEKSVEECFFWATHAHAELDLLLFHRGRRYGFEFKRADAPKVTRSMRIAMADLRLDHLFVVHPGADEYPIDASISTLGLRALDAEEAEWRRRLAARKRPRSRSR